MNSNFRSRQNPKTAANSSSATQAKYEEGLALHRKGQLELAQKTYREVLKLQPRHFEALHLLGVIAAQSKNYGQAIELIKSAIAINPNNATAHANCGNALQDLRQYQAAIDSYDKAIAIKPDYANAFSHRGKALYALKQYQAAIESYNKAVAIQPDSAETYFNRGLALYAFGLFQAAIASYDMAIGIRPDIAETYTNRGLALYDLKQHQAAIDSYDKAAALKPDSAETFFNRGLALNGLKQYQAAIDSFDKAFALNPSYAFLHGERLYAKINICDWSHVEDQVPELLQKLQCNQRASTAFPVLALTASPLFQRKAAEINVSDKYTANNELGNIPKRTRQEKIRIGYFSADFHNHATSHLIAGLFEQHDKDKHELFAFSFGPDANDEMRQRVSAAFDEFIDVNNQSDRDVALLCRRLEVDIAIDLMGFTQNSRFGIFSYRAAPIQVSYLGYPGTTGADYIDYLIADKTLIPAASQQHYAEQIAYLPNSYQINDGKRVISDKVFTRKELGLPQSGFVFCCFNNNYKITPTTFDSWMRILKQVPGSALWLFENNPTAANNLRLEAQLRGVDPGRLVFATRMDLPEHLARHRAADLFIDTLPYNAHTTASDALWAGLPVLTYSGEAFASRVAASLLTAVDLPELIATTKNEYEALAIELATNQARLKAIKTKLERNRRSTPLFDTQLSTRHIEDAYTQMYERYHADLAPAHIYVRQ